MRVEWGLRTTSLPTQCRRLGLTLGAPTPAAPGRTTPTHAESLRLVRAVVRVGRQWPPGDSCLRRCLVLGHLLRDEHPVLALGVARRPDGSVGAHAWLEVGGRSVDPLSSSYAALPLR